MSKKCQYCRDDNLDSATVCVNCDIPFIDGIASSNIELNKIPILIMTHLNSGKEIKITGNCTIGRNGNVEPEFFTDDNMLVSGHHCEVTFENDQYKIKHIGKNPTKINNDTVPKGISMVIRNGNYLTIADRKFEISILDENRYEEIIKSVSENDFAICENSNVPIETKYIITCPVCGFNYEVKTIDDKIKECNHCDDYGKHEISKIKVKVKYAN